MVFLPLCLAGIVALKKKKKRDTMAQIMRDTARFYLNNLYSGKESADPYLLYIQDRGLAPTTIKKFGLGFANKTSNDFYG